MLTMKTYLPAIAIAAAAAWQAAAAAPEGIRQVVAQKPPAAAPAAPRQLSPEERAELRRQLSQQRRVSGKRP